MPAKLYLMITIALTVIFLNPGHSIAAEMVGTLNVDAVATRTIAESVTDPKYQTRWVERLPEHPTIPSPRDYLGYVIGTPGKLTQVEEIHGYFKELAKHSTRIKVVSLGRSFEGRDMLMAVLADEQTLEDLDEYRDYLRALSDPRATSQAEADVIVEKAKPIFWMTAGLHSPELGPPEMVMELAYRLVVETRQPFTDIRNNIITLITPVTEVDGRARQVDWYRLHQKGKTDYYDRPPASVPFWGHYTYHDNNRDGISISQPLTRNYTQGVYEWQPTISLDLHESVPLLYVAGGTGPYNPGVSPITIGEWQALSSYEISRLTGLGLEGVWTWGYYTGWYPGYLLWTTNNHNAMGRFYETFGNASAETMERTLKGYKFAEEKVTKKTWYRASPPPRELTWSMRNNTNYMQSGVIASLEMVSNSKKMFLNNYYQKGVNALHAADDGPVFAFVIPAEQKDRAGANYLVKVLNRHAIEIQQAEKSKTFGKVKVKKGDLLIKLNQPFGPLAKTLLEKQKFPEKVQVPPYDDVGWTLGLSYGVDVKPILEKAVLDHNSSEFETSEPFLKAGNVPSKGNYLVIPHHGQAELGPIRFALGDVPVDMVDEEFKQGRKSFPKGSLLVSVNDDNRAQVRGVLGKHFIDVTSLRKKPEVAMHPLDLPRIAVLHSWVSTQNAGWVRYSLDEASVPFTLLAKGELKKGNLRDKYDVILVPAFRANTTFKDVLAGVDTKWSPLAYTQSQMSPNIGHLLSSEDITGGIGFSGMMEIEKFVDDGGTLITLASGGVIAAESGLVTDISVKRPAKMNTPGSILAAKVTSTSPLVYGYDELTHVFRGNGPIFSVKDHRRDWVSLQFGVKDYKEDPDAPQDQEAEDDKSKKKKPPLVISGGIVSGAKAIDGEPALISRAQGKGHVVLFNWNPMHRDVNRHDHAFVYNALMSWNDLNR
ncbi:MAG: M14 family zinc carboxypeptidase [bacterium]|nr:hypothetical protein [Gammaproteobacteria bacterium]HIL98167.1 hypothetical protein [Pseudomonadales bacterium]